MDGGELTTKESRGGEITRLQEKNKSQGSTAVP